MTDTPAHIEELQLKLWLSKSPGERLLQALKNNEGVYLMFKDAREKLQIKKGIQITPKSTS